MASIQFLTSIRLRFSTTKLVFQEAISSTFHQPLSCTKALFAAFLYLQFVFVIFWQKEIGEKAEHKMLMKLTAGRVEEEGSSYRDFLLTYTTRLSGRP